MTRWMGGCLVAAVPPLLGVIRIVLRTERTQEEIRKYYREATIRGAEENATISLSFKEAGDTADLRVIVEVHDRHGSDWDWRCE
ncbi:hypothetical protein [Nonomuraea rhodomycinica]|uniref:Uncharacterized protein n=1 Tax=Nonomuraea rhodomycinica TaxID=1712872 RepID=A0A7Y6IU71_9ACTN|nr:hypothetical protein [Nonomuraea rhodomycinica]NUW44472.1 hypothetical protein [Nonomuraea rhodomycinica]